MLEGYFSNKQTNIFSKEQTNWQVLNVIIVQSVWLINVLSKFIFERLTHLKERWKISQSERTAFTRKKWISKEHYLIKQPCPILFGVTDCASFLLLYSSLFFIMSELWNQQFKIGLYFCLLLSKFKLSKNCFDPNKKKSRKKQLKNNCFKGKFPNYLTKKIEPF